MTKKNWLDMQLEWRLKDFQNEAENFIRMMKVGGGIRNLHMCSCIENLQLLYQRVAVLEDAKRVMGEAK